jgi:hypothetical protein
MLNKLYSLLIGKNISQEGYARLAHVASIQKVHAKQPYILLSNLKYQVGSIFNACFVVGEDWHNNDFLPATVTEVRADGRVRLVWAHTYMHSNHHPDCVIQPKHIAVRKI